MAQFSVSLKSHESRAATPAAVMHSSRLDLRGSHAKKNAKQFYVAPLLHASKFQSLTWTYLWLDYGPLESVYTFTVSRVRIPLSAQKISSSVSLTLTQLFCWFSGSRIVSCLLSADQVQFESPARSHNSDLHRLLTVLSPRSGPRTRLVAVPQIWQQQQ
jgi:hypothetical protein